MSSRSKSAKRKVETEVVGFKNKKEKIQQSPHKKKAVASKQTAKVSSKTVKVTVKSVVKAVRNTDVSGKNNNAQPAEAIKVRRESNVSRKDDMRKVVMKTVENEFESGVSTDEDMENEDCLPADSVQLSVDTSEFEGNKEVGEILDYEDDEISLDGQNNIQPKPVDDARSIAADSEVVFHTTPTENNIMTMMESIVNQRMQAERENIRREIEREFEERSAQESKQDKRKSNIGKEVNKGINTTHLLKLPSDTTMYAPAFDKSPMKRNVNNAIIDQISNFVDEIRLQYKDSQDIEPSTLDG